MGGLSQYMGGAWGGRGGLKMLSKNTCDGVHLIGKDASRFNGGGEGCFSDGRASFLSGGDAPWGGMGFDGGFQKTSLDGRGGRGGRHPPHYGKCCRRRTAKEQGLGQFADL